MVLQGDRAQGHPRHGYPYDPVRAKKLLADAGQGTGFSTDVYAYQLPGLPEGKAFAEAVSGVLGEDRDQGQADPGRLSRLPQELGGPEDAGCDRLLQYRQPRLDGHLRPHGEDGLLAVQAQRHRERPRGGRDDRPGHQARPTGRRSTRSCGASSHGSASEHLGMPIVYLHSPYAASKKLGKWNPGTSCTISSSTSSPRGSKRP